MYKFNNNNDAVQQHKQSSEFHKDITLNEAKACVQAFDTITMSGAQAIRIVPFHLANLTKSATLRNSVERAVTFAKT
jgi:hypothetical protein